MELKQEAQTFEMPHLLTYYECDETVAKKNNIKRQELYKQYHQL